MPLTIPPAVIVLTLIFVMSLAAFFLYASIITWYKEKYRPDWDESRHGQFEFYRGCGAILVFWAVALGALLFLAYYVRP
jgi:hypothetical protein